MKIDSFDKVDFVSAKEFLSSGESLRAAMFDAIRDRNFQRLKELISDTGKHNPYLYPQLIKFYEFFIVESGDLSLANEVKDIIFEITSRANLLNDRTFKQPPILATVDYKDLGELVDKTIAINYLTGIGKSKKKPILPIPNIHDANRGALIPYLQDHFELVLDKNSIARLHKNMVLPEMTSFFLGHSMDTFCHYYEFVSQIPAYSKSTESSPVFKIRHETIEMAEMLFRKAQVDIPNDFVVVDLQDERRFTGRSDQILNRGLLDLKNSIKWLTDFGYKVVLLGDIKSNEFEGLNGLVSLSKVERCLEIDLFLISKSRFIVCRNSSGLAIAHAFGVPQLILNCCPFAGTRSWTFAQFSKLFWSKSNKQLKIKEMKESGLFSVYSKQLQFMNGIYSLPYSDEEVKETIKEMIDFVEGGSVYQQNASLKRYKEKLGIHGALCTRTCNLLN